MEGGSGRDGVHGGILRGTGKTYKEEEKWSKKIFTRGEDIASCVALPHHHEYQHIFLERYR